MSPWKILESVNQSRYKLLDLSLYLNSYRRLEGNKMNIPK